MNSFEAKGGEKAAAAAAATLRPAKVIIRRVARTNAGSRANVGPKRVRVNKESVGRVRAVFLSE